MTRRRRQLAFPGLGPDRAPAAPPRRARRDWSKAEFDRALARHGLRPMDGGLYFADEAGRRFEPICRREPVRIARRATLARILRQRQQEGA